MCFGMQETKDVSTTSTANPAVAAAATSNLGTAQNTLNNSPQGFGQEYTSPLTAAISGNQQATIDNAQSIANNGTGQQAAGMITGAAGAPASSVNAGTISSAMSPYMSSYVDAALKPQLAAFDINAGQQKNAIDAQATGSGAYGDARTGVQQSTNDFLSNQNREGLISNAYNTAFNTAIGAGAQDVSNNLTAQTTNAGLNETALNRQLTGATDLQNLQTQQLGVQTGANSLAGQDTANSQAALTAQYNNWLQAQQSQLAAQGSANQTVAAGAAAMPASTDQQTSQPNNSGLALGGALLSAVI